jgi:hypothetical protein
MKTFKQLFVIFYTLTSVVLYSQSAGNNTEIQFNNNGVLGASSNLTYDSETLRIQSGINDNSFLEGLSTAGQQVFRIGGYNNGNAGELELGRAGTGGGRILFRGTEVFSYYGGTVRAPKGMVFGGLNITDSSYLININMGTGTKGIIARGPSSGTASFLRVKNYSDSGYTVDIQSDGSTYFAGDMEVLGGIKIANDTDQPTADKAGTIRYNELVDEGQFEVCIQTGTTTYEWKKLVTDGDAIGGSGASTLSAVSALSTDATTSKYTMASGADVEFVNSNAKTLFFIDEENENIGIGTTTPSEKLEVNGLIRINGASTVDNNSPGLVLASNDDFLYDNQYINHYGFGFHGYQDGSSSQTEPANSYMSGYFGVDFFTNGENRMRISRDGIVSIGTVNRQEGYHLAVNGNIKSKEIKVETGWSDFVFYKNYNLPTLEQVETHIAEKGHLKDIPSAKEVAKNGIFLGDMNAKLLQKIEELTLYAIAQEKKITAQQKAINQLESLKKRFDQLEKLIKDK